MNTLELRVETGQVQLGQSEPMVLGLEGRAGDDGAIFDLIPFVARSEEPQFLIEHTYGEKKARMVSAG